jgi:hypothetical protein
MISLQSLLTKKNRIYICDTIEEALEKVRKSSKVKSKDSVYVRYLMSKRYKNYSGNSAALSSEIQITEVECYIPLYDISSKQWRSDYPKWRYVFKIHNQGSQAFVDLDHVALYDSYRYFHQLTEFELKVFKEILQRELKIL